MTQRLSSLLQKSAVHLTRIVIAILTLLCALPATLASASPSSFEEQPRRVIAHLTPMPSGVLAPQALRSQQTYVRMAASGQGADPHGAAKPKAAPEEPPIPKDSSLENLPPADQYCAKIGEIAANSQFAQQRKMLAKAQDDLELRIKALTEKTEEFKVWSKKYDDFTKKATESLLQIYLKMKPEIAAKQLLAMPPGTAAAVLAKLPAKTSSAILAEMEPARAARLSSVLAGAFKSEEPVATPAAPAEAPPSKPTPSAASPADAVPQQPKASKDKQ